MAQELTMPKLSDSMADAVIVRWLKSPGESFARGEGLLEVETDKATVIYEAESDGKLDSILMPEGATVAIGEPIATVANGERQGSDPAGVRPQQSGEGQGSDPAGVRPQQSGEGQGSDPAGVRPQQLGSDGSQRPNATPVARRTAVDLGVSLPDVAGTGPGGRITREDVERAAAQPGDRAAAPPAGGKGDVRVLELTTTQATIARRMAESATTIPTFTVSIDVDMSLIAALRKSARGGGGDVPSLNDFVVMAAARTVREFPRFNASYVDGKVECYSRVNVGIAVATDDALLVPVVRDADRKSLADIAADTRRLAESARGRAVQPQDVQDATFTVSNLGMFGVRSFAAIIDPPQVAILAVGGVHDGAMTATLTCDHRVVYGADGARFLSRLRELLERPLELLTGGV